MAYYAAMRIHIQNPPEASRFDITPGIWQAAVARAPQAGSGHSLSFGRNPEEFIAGWPTRPP